MATERDVNYQVTSQHWAHAEQIRWTLLYNYLMASTILLLAWATIFTTSHQWRQFVLFLLSLSGVLISSIWIALGIRASRFVDMYAQLGRMYESPSQVTEGSLPGPFTSANDHRNSIRGPARWVSSHLVLKCVPGIFVVVYLLLIFISVQ
jgi:hypothetical protein